jgi:hypothetical protein
MKTVKQPAWDRQEGAPIILTNPDGTNRNPSLAEPLGAGQQATGTIGGVEITVLLRDILTATRAEGEIIRILDGQDDRDFLDDLSIGDIVLIRRQDMYSLDVDTGDEETMR